MPPVGVVGSFPFLFGGTFIEGQRGGDILNATLKFPFLFGGTFIEGASVLKSSRAVTAFPFLFGGTFIEGNGWVCGSQWWRWISLPFRRDFH